MLGGLIFGRGTAQGLCFAGPLSLLRTAVGAPLGLGVEGRGKGRRSPYNLMPFEGQVQLPTGRIHLGLDLSSFHSPVVYLTQVSETRGMALPSYLKNELASFMRC